MNETQKAELLEKIEIQKKFVSDGQMKDPKERVKTLKKLRENLEEMSGEVCEALKADLNKSEMEAYMCEVGLVLSEISYMIKHCKRFSRIRTVATPLSQFHAHSFVVPCAYGRVLVMSPWNYPFLLSMEPLVDAVAAGNSVLLKPSSNSPRVSAVIEKLIQKTFEVGHVTTILCSGADSDELLAQKFDYIFYTGSAKVGQIVMKSAAENLTPVTLELGGKSPCIVDETANIALAAKRIVFGKFVNAGQTCVAPDYILCAKSVKEQLVKELSRQIVLQFSVDPVHNDEYVKIINQKQFSAAKELLSQSKIVFGGKMDEETRKIEPTLIDATFEDAVMQREIFAPLLPILTFETLDEAIAEVKKRPKPLALYVFSKSKQNEKKIVSDVDFGGGCVNDTIIHLASNVLPFGGVGESGMGAYHGKKGFDTFTHEKSIVDKKQWMDMPIRYAPYSKFKLKLIKFFLK